MAPASLTGYSIESPWHGGSVAMIPVAIALTVVLGPLLLGLAGALRAWRAGGPDTRAAIPWSWTLTLGSALLYTLAFNLTFFIQELFLVLPKAFLPGVRPTLFHNNHDWVGENPLTSLFQGTGALAIFVSGIAFGFRSEEHTSELQSPMY